MIGELWALAITLRIVLVENLRRIAARIVESSDGRHEADALADRLLGAGGHATEGSRCAGPAAAVDHIAQNNTRAFAIDNRPKQYRILYVCGRPNWQNKFFRMALEEDDKQLKLTSLIAISRCLPASA